MEEINGVKAAVSRQHLDTGNQANAGPKKCQPAGGRSCEASDAVSSHPQVRNSVPRVASRAVTSYGPHDTDEASEKQGPPVAKGGEMD